MAPPMALNCYKVIYREMLKKHSSQELLHQIGQYLAWSFPSKRRFKSVQIKFLGSQMVPPQGLKLLKKSSQEPPNHFQPNLVGNMLGRWGYRFFSNKGGGPFWSPIRAK